MISRLVSRGLLPSLGSLFLLSTGCADPPIATVPAAAPPGPPAADVAALADGPQLVDPSLAVRTVVGGLVQPTAMAFIGPNDFLVLEKASGQVRRVTNGVVQGVVLDLPVNSASERGLLGIALPASFPADPSVYLYWTESSTGADSPNLADVPVRGNRVDRFVWNGSTLAMANNVVQLRSYQADAGQPLRGNHNGGVIDVGPDGKLYVFIGDNGRRGWLQNLRCGPTNVYNCPPNAPVTDDQFGGPQPDAAHLTGVVLRLDGDGTAPTDNPFFSAGAAAGGEFGASIQKIFSYGHRNSIGMAFDPVAGNLWLEENGDDSFTELNLVDRGMNGGWVQIAGPASRVPQFKAIETSPAFNGLQQIRWPPANLANFGWEALLRLYMLPGATYSDPEFAWKFEVAPAGLGFIRGGALGAQYAGDLVLGGARETLLGGHLFRFDLSGDRRGVAVSDPRLADRVADNTAKFDITESETLLFGSRFGVVTDIQTGPNGNLFLVSLSHGNVYEIYRLP